MCVCAYRYQIFFVDLYSGTMIICQLLISDYLSLMPQLFSIEQPQIVCIHANIYMHLNETVNVFSLILGLILIFLYCTII